MSYKRKINNNIIHEKLTFHDVIKNIHYSFVITCLLFARHFLIIGQPYNAFYYGQTFKGFIYTSALICLIFLIICTTLSVVKKYYQKQHKKIVVALLCISLLPLLDYSFISAVQGLSGYYRILYAIAIFLYIPLIVLISYKYQIEKYGEKTIIVLSLVCAIIIYYAIPQPFSKNVIENKFISKSKNPVHLIVFDGMSYEFLNGPDSKHLFPNINVLFASKSFVFEDAHSPGGLTVLSIPKMLTGIQYERYRAENLQLFIANSKDQDYTKLPTDGSLFQISKSQDYNNVLIGGQLPYVNLFGKYLNYGRAFPSYSRLCQILPVPFQTLFYIRYRHFRNTIIDSFNEYLSRIDSSPQNTFFFFHVVSPHAPYVFDSQGFSRQYWNVILKGGSYKQLERYVEQLRFIDKKVGEIIKKLKDNNLYDKSLIIITSDHNYFGGFGDLTKVPLLIKTPFQKNQHIVKEAVYTINLKKFFSTFFESQVIDVKKLE